MNLQTLQVNLLNLVKSRSDIDDLDDAYLREVASSQNLVLAKKIVLWWRQLQIQNYCVLTTRLLESYGKFEKYTQQFATQKFSVFSEEAGDEFIDFINLAEDTSPLLRSVSTFEKALIKLYKGDTIDEVIPWCYEPMSVIQSLLDRTFSESVLQSGDYEVRVSNELGANLFSVAEINPALT